ncbi:MAG: RNA polymerase sigma factor [Clostridia bacterium]|nr:RNA polymerase sigma factor [Clostridia bacterium]
MSKAEINALLTKTARGDNAAFEKLYIVTRKGVFSFLYTYLRNYADAEDAMQTVYLKIKRGIASYQAGTNGSAWILQIAKNHALNELKKRRQAPVTDDTESVAKEPVYSMETGVMQTMNRVLSEEEQRIVTLHVLWGYKHREIGALLACPTGTVTSKYKRAIEKLRKALKEEER